MNRQELVALLDERVLVCDGGMGTRLYDLGIPFERCFDEINVAQPALVRQVHDEYLAAGADVIETNTFAGNRIRLAQWGLEGRVDELNRAGVAIARSAVAACGRPVLVAGSVGPLGRPLAPIGRVTREQAHAAFHEQATSLVSAGVDLLILETFTDQAEMVIALEAVRQVTADLAIVALMTFTDEGKTLYGNKPEEVARALMQFGADVVGANCSVGPRPLVEVVERMLHVPGVRICVQPNAGMPELVGGRYLYLSSPEYMGGYARDFAQAGVRMVGGCCGTGPEHVAAIRERVAGVVAADPTQGSRVLAAVREADTGHVVTPEPGRPIASSLRAKLQDGHFVVSVELDPPRGVDPGALIKGAELCKANGIDAINIADSPMARARMSPLALGVLIRQAVDMELVLHLSCRDRNLLGLQSESMSMYALGIRNVLAVTGDPPVLGDYPDATGVFDLDSIGLVTLIQRLNSGVDLAGKKIDYNTSFFVGVASNPTAVDLGLERERFQRKLEVGAQFTMTQPIYDIRVLERWMTAVEPPIPTLVGILPLRNARHAEFIHNEVPGMMVPEGIRARMHGAAHGPLEGVRIAREFLLEARQLVQGAYLMPPFNRFEMAIDVCQVL
ncbi:MAG: hypothetical protein AMXMBFR64_48480 [Myxococcales bacterium]